MGATRNAGTMLVRGFLVAAIMALAGCAPVETDAPETDGTGAAEDGEETPDNGDTTGTGAEVDPDAVLRYAWENPPSRFDPHRSTLSQDNTTLFLTYDRLVHQAPDGSAVPGLATSWTFADDGSVLELELREGVTFHDGTPFDGEAVRANIERAQTIEGGTQAGDLGIISEVEVVEDHLVRFHLDGPGAALPLILSDRAGAMISPAAFENPDLDQMPVGAGMYRVVRHNVDSLIVYEPYDEYWDPEAVRLGGVEVHLMPDAATRANALRTGAVDWAIVASSDYDALTGQSGLDGALFDDLAYVNQPLNKGREPLQDVRVRQALNHAMDREALVATLLDGLGTACSQPWPQGYVAFNEEIGCDYYEYDPARARELLAEAGYPEGFDLLLIGAGTPESTRRAEAVTAYLEDIGLTVRFQDAVAGTVGDVWLVEKQGDMLVGTWGGRPDAGQMLQLQYGAEGFLNPGAYESEALEELLPQINDPTLSDEERAAVLQEATRVAVEEALDVPLYFPALPNVFSERLVGAEAYLSGKQEFRGVGLLPE